MLNLTFSGTMRMYIPIHVSGAHSNPCGVADYILYTYRDVLHKSLGNLHFIPMDKHLPII